MPANTTAPEAPSTADLQNFCALGMEQVMEIEKASLAALVSLSSYAIDLSRSACLFAPITFSPLPGDFFDVATKAYASLLDLQMHWLTLLMPQAANADTGSSVKVRMTAKTLEHPMDAVIGTPKGSKSES